MLSDSLKTFMGEASETYYQALKNPGAESAVEYLKSRGLLGASVQYFRLGYVESPLPGHEKYVGRISIPYITRSGVTDIRFRALPDLIDGEWVNPEGPKILSLPGCMHRLYNTQDLDRREPYVCITEGEPDTWIAHQCGLPAVAVPGVAGWSDWWARCFRGYEAVYILCDNDDKGQGAAFGEKLAAQIQNARVVLMPPGHDVNSYYVAEGREALLSRIGVEL